MTMDPSTHQTDVVGAHPAFHVGLVGQHQDGGPHESLRTLASASASASAIGILVVITRLFQEQVGQLDAAVVDAIPVGRIDHPDQPVGLLVVVPPVRSQRLLAAHIP